MPRAQQPQNPFHEVGDVTDRPGLRAVPRDGRRLTPRSLREEGGEGPPALGAHPGAEGVEEGHVRGVHAWEGWIASGEGLGLTLGLVVHAARPDGVDLTPEDS